MGITPTFNEAEQRGMNELYDDGSAQYNGMPKNTHCFYCHAPLVNGLAIDWLGHGAHIYMHPACATALCIRLMRDIHEAEILTHYPGQKLAVRHFYSQEAFDRYVSGRLREE